MTSSLREKFETAGFVEYQTGGGCRAWRKDVGAGAAYILITDSDGCSLPDLEDETCLTGFYAADGEELVNAETSEGTRAALAHASYFEANLRQFLDVAGGAS